ncbi:cytochrome b5 domain-containing protein 1 [Hydra vulgaris]|uniref:Cytochrome b5 domain-containing protein 1 n=1 Tax=Hydra vulgaris TaxID=6087 RepID=T2MBV6_HYDVU|nr:cytochrome b5 domain-containing protein 1 [Hydra vulgaris]
MNNRPKYFTPFEVSLHNTEKDIWVSYLGKVYDLSPLCAQYQGDTLLKPILHSGGKDISHWFDKKTQDIRLCIDPVTNCQFPYTPMGRFLHTPPLCPRTDWCNDFGRPWWKSINYCIGVLTKKVRKIRIINTLTSHEQVLEVCCEETISEILQRYLFYNVHASSYTWKYRGINLDMEKTLEENQIEDESEVFYTLGLDEDMFLPSIHIYFNDDLTDA